MTEERAKRKLSAILSADVKGYSRLMQDHESSTIQTLKAYRELMTSLIQEYRGRVVDSPGDNVLAVVRTNFPIRQAQITKAAHPDRAEKWDGVFFQI
jgi:class 3 adenylate cyclase